MKIFLAIFLAAVIFSGCANSNGEIQQTSAVPTVTAPTVTESLTEPEPEPEPPVEYAELATFDPFADCVKVDDAVWDELAEAVEKVSDWEMISQGHYDYSGIDDFCDETAPLEGDADGPYCYYPVNEKYAGSEDELFILVRRVLTENFCSDERLRERLFEDSSKNTPANFKTVDGVLCAKKQYIGVPEYCGANLLRVINNDGGTAYAVTSRMTLDYPPGHFFMKLVRSGEGAWRLDNTEESGYYWEHELTLFYNALALRTDTLNRILGGGSLGEGTAEIDGELYQTCKIDMSIEDMKNYFTEVFRENSVVYAGSSEFEEGVPLRDAYIKKYIDDVYAERDGVLYRKAAAPRWYLPETDIDTYSEYVRGGAAGEGESCLVFSMRYREPDGGSFYADTAISYEYGEYGKSCRYLYIAGELPIRQIGMGR